ncbi:thioredoxin-related transmembrane protein 1 isoform X2 [Sabethes cyaneus]|uniref:thioredoxin-related transmembrane protein 1 isoform X2 n=1 Tax=Sabethes cyaneus TaxID=53552 RepID=UPI00237EAFD7|nr:thioredoxin-related transmembrane protein 1 isoform X2 [Sabethes cyaneus]
MRRPTGIAALLAAVLGCWLCMEGLGAVAAAPGKSNVIELDESNWDRMLTEEWLVEFYAPWCPACKSLAPVWDDLSTWSDDLNVKTAKIDVTTSPGLSGRFFVTALPTIFHVLDGEFRQYKGARDLNSLMTFIEEKKWQAVEKIPPLTKPSSPLMAVISVFFRASQLLKEINAYLATEYGIPVWVSYVGFAISTILFGALVGLIFVCIIDLFFPPPSYKRKSFSEHKQSLKHDQGHEELKGDDLEDEDEQQEASVQEEEEEEGTSEGEKYSGSDSDEAPESDRKAEDETESKPSATPEKPEEETDKKDTAGSPDLRKRKPRKAD